MKRYEKNSFLRFFALFFAAFMLMFILLSTLYYLHEEKRLTGELEITATMEFITCKRLKMADCQIYKTTKPQLLPIYKNISYAFGLILLIFIPISYLLSLFAIKPVYQASTMIDNFIANIVHDINTPIATIMLNAKSLLKKSKEVPKKLTRILSSAKQLIDMQHDLLALADEKDEIEKEAINLKSISEEITEGFKLQYASQSFQVLVKEQMVQVNSVDLRRIIQNLLSNAVKYNKNENLIKIYTQETYLVIEDKGKGIKHPEKIFDKNYREDYRIQGNGLGLASVLSMLQRNNIDITVQSQLNIGTKIMLNFR